MRVGIIQSGYLPWRGYFDFIDDVDLFIFFDDVQFTVRDWRTRNKIKTPDGWMWLTVPVRHLSRDQLIQYTTPDYSQKWRHKHRNSIANNYAKAPYFFDYIDGYADIIGLAWDSISTLNVCLTKWMMDQFEIDTQIEMSSVYKAVGTKTDRLIDILKKCEATIYLTGPSAIGYLEPEKFEDAGISLEYKTYDYGEYPQLWGDFLGDMSAIDLLFNCGPDSRKYLKSRSENAKG